MSKYVKLIFISENNNNKYYEMIYEGGNNFTINYGRIESTKTTLSKPYKKWDSIYNEKIKKGYKDVTHLVSEIKEDKKTQSSIDDIIVGKDVVLDFLYLMKKYTDGLVSKTYTVKAKDVTLSQITTAQRIIDELLGLSSKDDKWINSKLIELYMIIPRYMGKVQNYLLPNIDLNKTLQQEQDNIDALSYQINTIKISETSDAVEKNKSLSLLDLLGVEMTEAKEYSEIKYLIDQIPSKKIKNIFTVNKKDHNDIFNDWLIKQNNKDTKFLLHGTRCTSVIPIIEQGLKIRPSGNFQFSGKVYGEGSYFSEVVSKSLNYTGYDPDKILLVYEVHVGNPFIYNGWYRGNSFPLNYEELRKRGYDSTYVKAGNGLLNSEIIAYKETQYSLKYIIWLN